MLGILSVLVRPRSYFRWNRLKNTSTLSPEKWLFVVTHPGTGIIQHNKNDEDVRTPGSLDCRQDSVFALEEEAAPIRDHQEELCSVCSRTQGKSIFNNNSKLPKVRQISIGFLCTIDIKQLWNWCILGISKRDL